MGGTRVQNIISFVFFDPADILHFKTHFAVRNTGAIRSVNGHEAAFGTGDPEFAGKGGNAPAPISTHGAFPSVGIEIHHFEIQLTVLPYQHSSVRPTSDISEDRRVGN